MSDKTALIIGVTGLVGRELLNVVLKDDYYSKVLLIGRSSSGIKDSRIEEILIDFDKLADYKDKFSAEHYYCCIGTTMANAKSKEAFFKVDYSYPLEVANFAKEDSKFEQFHLVSSYGANSNSGIFYNEVKGKIEDSLKELGLKTLHIFQPSLLIGHRKDFRLWEEMAKMGSVVLSFFIIGSRLKFWSILGSEVAESMFVVAKSGEIGIHVHKPLEMKRVAFTKEYKGDNSITADI